MSDGLWEQAKSIFADGLDIPPANRAEWLRQTCGGDDELRTLVSSLLESHARAGDFLADPTVPPHPPAGRPTIRHTPGDSIDRYRLMEVLGEGGFGVVYMAQQEQPVRRRVALKIIKPGMDSAQVVRRFEAERQALAMMDHPNIARVLDAGHTADGLPFFVMELVRGKHITAFCERRRLTPHERIALCVPICHAVQHAHQKGVIHRDLKPSNILISVDDDRPTPKIIDFGVAKALGEPLTDGTLLTEFRQFVGTPAYMSPEQAGRSDLDVDTRSDVYSLGVLLYELLTGCTPFDAETLRAAPPDEIRRMIREVDPPRPSTRVGRRTTRSVSTSGAAARERAPDAAGLMRLLRGDLDWIIMRSLEKDRARRYPSASDLAQDLERFLRQEPVSAGPPGAAYRVRKFARRHRAGLAVALSLLIAVVGGLAFSISGFMAANRARALAEANAAEALAMRDFLLEMLSAADPKVQGDPDLKVRTLLDDAVQKLDSGGLRARPEVESSLRATIGRAYRELALYEPAERQLQAALDGQERLHGPDHTDVADALTAVATLYTNKSDYAAAEPLFRRALAINRRRRAADDAMLASNLCDLGTTVAGAGRLDEAEALLNEALAIARLPANSGKNVLAEALNNLALIKHFQAKDAEAEPLYREALAMNRALLGDAHPNVATNLDNFAVVVAARGDYAAAEAAYREALAIRRKVFPNGHPELATTLHNLGTLCAAKGDWGGAEEYVAESLDMFRRIHGLKHPDSQTVASSMVSIHARTAALDAAERLLLECHEAASTDPPMSAALIRGLARRLAELYTARDQPEVAARWQARSVEADATPPASEDAPTSLPAERPAPQ